MSTTQFLRPEPVADDVSPASEQATAAFRRDGVLGPIRLFTEAQCRIIADTLRTERPAAGEWSKGRAVTDRFFYELATRPALIALVRALLGPDVILWGARTIERRPGQTHVWHSDIESCAADGGYISAWVGIENTSQESALQVVTRSHLCGKSVQQVLHERGLRRGEPSSEEVLAFAREVDAAAELRQPVMTDGEMLLYDGRLWHGSHNARPDGQRIALLLQYAAADVPVRMPDFKQLEWPFRYLETPRPPVIRVSGMGGDSNNRIVPAPVPNPDELSLLASAIRPVPRLGEDAKKRMKSQRLLRGRTTVLDFFNCHVSTLAAGHSPHPPHAHAEEELLIVLDGAAELLISDSPAIEGARSEPVRPGAFVYYPPFQHHTIRNPGPAPVTYLMFKWRGGAAQASPTLPTSLFHYGDLAPDEPKGYWASRLIRDPTPYLARLGCHLSVLQPQKGYRPHRDAYDVAILLLTGEVETLGERVSAPSVIYYAAGEPHGLRNVGDRPARYLVFEFHAATERAVSGIVEAAPESVPAPAPGETSKPAEQGATAATPKRASRRRRLRRFAEAGRRWATRLKRLLARQGATSRSGGGGKPTAWLQRRRAIATIREARKRMTAGDLEGALAVYRDAPPHIRRLKTVRAKRQRIAALRRKQRRSARHFIRELHRFKRSGDTAGALAVCEAAAPALREHPKILREYARLLQRSRRFGEAYEAFSKVLTRNPPQPDAWMRAGSCLVRLRSREELSALIARMLDAVPATPEVLIDASSLARRGELHALAARLCERALSSGGMLRPSAAVAAARVLLREGEQGRVITLLDREEIRRDPAVASEARDLEGLARAQLRLASGAEEGGTVSPTARADVLAVQAILDEARAAQAAYRAKQGTIAIVLPSLGPGGVQTQVVQLVRQLREGAHGRIGAIVILPANRSKLLADFHKSTLLNFDVTIEPISDFGVRLADVVPADTVGRLSVLSRPMVTRIGYLIDRLRTHRPSVVLTMGDIIGFPAMLAALTVGVPRVVVSARGESPLTRGANDRLLKSSYQAALARNAITLVTNSRATARNFADWLELPAEALQTIYNGVHVDRLLASRDRAASAALRHTLNIADGARVVGSVFHYRREKRPELWIEAAAIIARRVPDVVFVTVGSGPLFDDCGSLLRRLGLEHRFHRPGTRSDVAVWIDLMDVFLMTSATEGTPNALLEAQALGRPVVATAVGGNAETFLPDETGILLPPDPTAEEAAEAVVRILNDPSFSTRARARGPDFILRRFHAERMAGEFVDLCFGASAADDAPSARLQG
jgi:glycosyltransferase involved in cell wall biosynthesis/mannose-6-phosphate isomerase-like protein (cupin superfamily)/Flp pilus assembly protein TadD